MDYMDEEEKESRFSKKSILKWSIFIAGILIFMLTMFFFLEGVKKKSGEEQQGEKKVDLEVEMDSIPQGRPFILDDEKTKEMKKIEPEDVKKDEVKKNLSTDYGNRIVEYSEIDLPEILEPGSIIDVRVSLGDGRDYTVLSSKKTGDFNKKEGKELIWLSLSDSEIVKMDSVLSDLSLFEHARLYAVLNYAEGKEEIEANYPVNYKSEKLLKKKNRKKKSKDKIKISIDKELNEDRLRLIELKNGRIGRWKEAASYWEE